MKQAMLVLDIQNAFFTMEPKAFEANEVIERVNYLTALARMQGVPVIFMQSEFAKLVEHGSQRWQMPDALSVESIDVRLRKSQANGFINTELHVLLQKYQCEEVIICGYASEFCVDSTIRYASTLGYSVVLVGDAHTTHDKPHLDAQQIREHHIRFPRASPWILPLQLSADAKLKAPQCSKVPQ